MGNIEREMTKWAEKGVGGHMCGQVPWVSIEDFVAEQSAKIVGCKTEEVTAMNSLTANIHFALVNPVVFECTKMAAITMAMCP